MVDEQGQPLHAAGKAHPGHVRAAEGRHQPVVAAAAGHRGLGADGAGHDLEGGAHVVVESPDQPGIEHVFQAGGIEKTTHGREVCGALRAQVVGDLRGVGRELLALGHLAVEDAQRVGELSAHAVLAQLFLVHPLKEFPQDVEKDRTAGRTTQGVELHGELGEPQFGQVVAQHEQDLGVEQRLGRSHRLHVDLVELAHAAFLGPFVPEHGPVGEIFGQAVVGALFLDQRPHDPGRGLGAQGQGTALAVRKGVHLLLDHVGFLADGPGKQLRAFENRNAQFLVAVAGENRAGGRLDKGENAGVRREEVSEAFDFLYFFHLPGSGVGAGGRDVEKEDRT